MKVSDELPADKPINNHFFENIFLNLPVASALLSGQSKIVACNRVFQNLFALPDDEMSLPVDFEDLNSSFWQKTDVQQYLHFVLEDSAAFNDKTFDWQQKDGSFKYIQVQSQLLPSTEKMPASLLIAFSDVSASRQIEKEHNERIRHMMHELRNPLSNISLCVELLADSTKENNQEDTDMFLNKASNSVQRMKQLINDLNTARKVS